MFGERNRRILSAEMRKGLTVLAAAVAITGCGGGDAAKTSAISEQSMLTFDALGGGSPTIQVYSGPRSVAADREPTGAYSNGESVAAECKIEGRTVSSDTSVGEEGRTSSDWVRIEGGQYATAVYIEKPQELLEQLPGC